MNSGLVSWVMVTASGSLFGLPQVDELYEAYCIQRRLQDGASKMKQAFGSSPASRAARESLSEINRSYKEYTEVSEPWPEWKHSVGAL